MPELPAIDRIPIGRNITYAVRGMPEVPNAYGPGFLIPTEVSLTYRASEDSRLGRFHAYVKGQWRRDGEVVPSGEKLPGQHYYGDPSTWPAWLAEEARLHDPDAATAEATPVAASPERANESVPSVAADRAAVLTEAADALERKFEGASRATIELRRMAGEAPATEEQSRG
jgi:hypothetical protein